VFNASTSPPKEWYAVTETNVFELTQPGTFSDPLTEINGNFGEPVRILVPEDRARRPIAEGPLALEQLTRRGKPSVGRQHGRPHPSHGIAEMVDVNDLAEVVRPVCPAIRVIRARPGLPLSLSEIKAVTKHGKSKP
jgi:hypothetical protein